MMKNKIEFRINPISKPRMVNSDRWANRPPVLKYFAFKDELNLIANNKRFVMPACNYHLRFYLPMPKSWPKKKKDQMRGMPHQQTPDKDNLEKAFLDALCKNDSHVWDGRVTKRWHDTGTIIIEF